MHGSVHPAVNLINTRLEPRYLTTLPLYSTATAMTALTQPHGASCQGTRCGICKGCLAASRSSRRILLLHSRQTTSSVSHLAGITKSSANELSSRYTRRSPVSLSR